MRCIWTENGNGVCCVNCGHARRRPSYRNCALRKGLGDSIAGFTSAIGIKPCGGCKGRQGTLNKKFSTPAFETGASWTMVNNIGTLTVNYSGESAETSFADWCNSDGSVVVEAVNF